MKRSRPSFARYVRLLLLLVALLLLPACKRSTKPYIEPTPPPVHCASQVPAAPLPPLPSPLALDDALVWMGKAIGVYQGEVTKRATTAACLARLRQAGLIQ